ncbi:MAG: hypothetical protein D3906_04585, partial [Candidatus Electrothrix sp. AUS1_2]|nr:hypothetical protein [Candidatus Electrothrix sp. AUS1_2]
RPNGLATSGSWPNWTYYIAHSPVIAELWSDPLPGEKALFEELLGGDPWKKTVAEWATDHMFFMRILTLRLWLAMRGRFC